jgi:hypothetical protein
VIGGGKVVQTIPVAARAVGAGPVVLWSAAGRSSRPSRSLRESASAVRDR